MLGTTQFVNAVIEQKGLSKVFVVRLCGTATAALPPFTGIPLHLTQSISAGYMLAPGGSTACSVHCCAVAVQSLHMWALIVIEF